jgi:hypothetical protein
MTSCVPILLVLPPRAGCAIKQQCPGFHEVSFQIAGAHIGPELEHSFRSEFTRRLGLPTVRIQLELAEDDSLYLLFPSLQDSLPPCVDIGQCRVAIVSVEESMVARVVVQ